MLGLSLPFNILPAQHEETYHAAGYDNYDENVLIDIRDLRKDYKTPAGSFPALKGIDMTIGRGEFIAVMGKSGAGKSTLVNMLTGIDKPTSGQIWIGGEPVHSMNETEIARWRGQNLGVVFQFFQLIPTLTVLQNVVMPMDFANLYSRQERYERAMELLERVEIAENAHKLPTAVSGGQQQRVAIARALAVDPALIVADEPTGSLDTKTTDAIFNLFHEVVAQGKTLLMVTHDEDLADRADNIITIQDGQLVA